MLLVMLPSLATMLLASREPSFSIFYHYQTSVVPFMVMGAAYGVDRCGLFLPKALGRLGGAVERQTAVAALAMLVFVSSLLGNVLFAQSPISLLFYNSKMESNWRRRYVPNERARYFFKTVRPLVPDDASVSATEFVATTFAAREDDFVFPRGVGEVDYIVIDMKDRWLDRTALSIGSDAALVLSSGVYEKLHDAKGFVVYAQRGADAP
jgi:uncharacterized membrane protein